MHHDLNPAWLNNCLWQHHSGVCFQEPIIKRFFPSYGPVSGGTSIRIELYAFEDIYNVTFVYVANTSANVTYVK